MEERRRFFFGEQRPRFPASKDTDFRRGEAPISVEQRRADFPAGRRPTVEERFPVTFSGLKGFFCGFFLS
jgi:hypothetical protein